MNLQAVSRPRRRFFVLALVLGATITVACSEEPADAAAEEQDVTAWNAAATAPTEEETACTTTSDCVAVAAFPCCYTTKIAVNQAARARIEKRATALCTEASCAPELGPADARTAACQDNVCVMVAPPEKPEEPIAEERRCTQASDCAAYQPMPCCSRAKEAVNQAGLAAAEKRAADACLAAACAPDLGGADERVPACEQGECTLVLAD
jgi:hypothetical protein